MATTLHEVSNCSPSLTAGSYIFAITSTVNGGIAAITSADELLVLDRRTLAATSPVTYFQGVPTGISCLVPGNEEGSLLLCAGRDGTVAIFDVRSKAKVSQFKSERAVTALVSRGNDVALGTELAHQQSVVSVWDTRQQKQRWQNAENNDDITDLQFHPSKPAYLLSGGIDGLVSVFDTQIMEEDDSLVQVVNHGPIHKAGFLGDSIIYALSSDEHLSLHPTTIAATEDMEDPKPVLFGDLRPLLHCQYAIGMISDVAPYRLAVGSHSSNRRVDLIAIENEKFNHNTKISLEGAHGDEIVRSVVVDKETKAVFTAGEDGQIRVFNQLPRPESDSKKPKAKTGSDARYKPY